MAYHYISKLEVARKQLETSIKLFFISYDTVSTHTLVASSHQVLEDLGKEQGIDSIINEGLKDIRPELKSKIRKKIREAQNFFKHATDDPQETLKFNPELTETLLFDACEMYGKISGEVPEEIAIYKMWYAVKHCEAFEKTPMGPQINDLNANLDFNNKTSYYNLAKEAARLNDKNIA